ncbi:hypothetical protein [Microbulbifer sp. YPW1]|uniref:hypothetical protein n=1 Tax=Microbulbifer sp. YPW1 TaxID=2745199 RepID=UPI00159844B8|nr:hypothetical protein [Microbulbifer sp. YPW1]QKX18629.1 hypothetical protein HUW35_17565 [Microbulbifer sp. YPW1]
MKKLVVPAIAIAAIGGYFYYANLDSTAPEAVTAEETIVEEMEAAVAEAETAAAETAKSSEEMMASVEGDVFADVPEAMGHALDETSEAVEEAADDVADKVAEVADDIESAAE